MLFLLRIVFGDPFVAFALLPQLLSFLRDLQRRISISYRRNVSFLRANHMVGALLRLLIHFQAFLPSRIIFERLPGFVHHFERELRTFLIILILVRMHKYREASVPLLDLVDGRFWFDLKHFEWIQIQICRAWPKQTIYLLVRCQHRVSRFDLFHLKSSAARLRTLHSQLQKTTMPNLPLCKRC